MHFLRHPILWLCIEKDELVKPFSHEKACSSNVFESDSDNDCILSDKNYTVPILTDVGYWLVPMKNDFRPEVINRGSKTFQNAERQFKSVYRRDEKQKVRFVS